MKSLYALILLGSVYFCSGADNINAQTVPDSIPHAFRDKDSIPGVMLLSAEGEENANPLGRLIPCTPQAASLARYAEYPVSLTTGIPDISIPLYEIRMGEFTLPISISYHASGTRPDEVPSCIGLGWTLNAGGAVTRTILGGPDMEVEDAARGDYSYYRMSRIDSLIQDVKKDAGGGHLRELTNPMHYRDSESDRYCFNAGGHVGVFRYSYRDGKYICLDRSSCWVESSGSRENSSFKLHCPDNTVYRFTVHEKTGTDPNLEGAPFTTAWYVSQIDTPYGDINFTYMNEDFSVKHTSTSYVSSYFLEFSAFHNGDSEIVDKFAIKSQESSEARTYFRQRLVSSIEWNGNTVDFEYAEGNPDDLNHRLVRMTVRSSDGTVVKTVDFGNEVPWKCGSDSGRRMLSGLDDSVEGRYAFTYFKYSNLPNVIKSGNPSKYTDSWGYYNGGNGSGADISRELAEWLRYDHNGMYQYAHTTGRDRSPVLDCARLGVLETITFPTGGVLTYAYELNELNSVKHGGLRVASTTLQEGERSNIKKYSYSAGVFPQMPPDALSKHMSYIRVCNHVEYYSETRQSRTVYSSPVYSAFSRSAPVLYTRVTEVLSDGRYTVYEYDPLENRVPDNHWDWLHPSSYPEALIDMGLNEPVLTAKSMYSASGALLHKETNTYIHKELSSFETGVRLISVIDTYVHEGRGGECLYHETEFQDGVGEDELLRCQTTARQIATVLQSTVTEDCTTGVTTKVSYTYDPQYRTLRPVTETMTNSDGTVHVKRYEYPFHRTGEFYRSMVEQGFADWVLATSKYIGGSLIARNETEYQDPDAPTFISILPLAWRSWSAPTASSLQSTPTILPDRWEVGGYSYTGKPESIVVNGTDLTEMTWNRNGDLLSFTAPGGLTTKYTQHPLIGMTSMTLPNGHKTSYYYNSAGMLSSVSDNDGLLSRYSYSIVNHPVSSMTGTGNSVTSEKSLHYAGSTTVKSRQYHDGLGRPTVSVQGGTNTVGEYLFSAVSYDAFGREYQTVLPSVGGNDIESRSFALVKESSASTYSDQYAWSETTYDALDRPLKVTTPGDAWHSAGKAKTTEYISNAANSVRLYHAPMDRISLVEDGYYAEKTLQGVRTVDEDGNEMTVYTDRLGRKVLERRGPESKKGQNDTYFVHNALGQLRYVLSPGYERAGYKDEYAYEYRYDEHGNVVKKFIPGAGYTQYWYDRAGRLAFMQDPNLREEGLHRFFVYDRAGRLALQGVSASCSRGEAVNFADYTGGTTGFMQTGYTLQNASRIQQVILEVVNYYDTYTFASALDASLYKAGSVSAKGLQTGSVVYNSDDTRSLSAVYYDIRGNVTESRERTAFGTLRTTVNTYTYTGQPLKSTVTEGSVTTVTENTYHASSGLLTATDVTVNGVKQRVSAVEYDDLGRIASVTRGVATNSGGKVSYKYNLHGQTTEINGPAFTQNLYYTDGPGKKLYNGSVSAMTWTMGTDTRVRGYKYTYNGYGWLTAAEYGEHSNLGTNTNRYTERFLEFMPNGGVRRMQRHGLKADGVYGKVDNLHISYDGNRISTVLEDASAVTQNGSMDYPGGNREMAFGYNGWGALVMDESRGISDISYDRFGNPELIIYTGGASTYNVYSASGEKLRTRHSDGMTHPPVPDYGATGQSTTTPPWIQNIEYHGNVIYSDGKVDMVLFPGGYATINGSAVTFHYYTQDYLGNNRAVINGSTGAIEQTVAYYPYGGVIADLGTNQTSGQPYKFGGKELITANGLNEYDFGARQYYTAVPFFTKPDSHCEKYYWLSPYLYCANNPVNLVDPTGMDSWTLDEMGNIISQIETQQYDEIISVNRKNENVNIWKGEYGSIKQRSGSKNNDGSMLVFSSRNDEIGLSVFEFLADNSSVEWSVLQMGLREDNIENVITTSHEPKSEAGATAFIVENIFKIDIRNAFHSHPSGIEYPSGLEWDAENPGDVQFADWVDKINRNIQAVYKIYNPLKRNYIEYNSWSTYLDFKNEN